jgi:hypothetical protein
MGCKKNGVGVLPISGIKTKLLARTAGLAALHSL